MWDSKVAFMKIQRASSTGIECPRLTAYQLPANIVDRAANGLCWVSLIGAVTSVALTFIEHLLQPEFAAAWAHPVLRITSLCVFLLSVGFIAVQRSGMAQQAATARPGNGSSGGGCLLRRTL